MTSCRGAHPRVAALMRWRRRLNANQTLNRVRSSARSAAVIEARVSHTPTGPAMDEQAERRQRGPE